MIKKKGNYTFEIRGLQLLICPPWGIYKLISGRAVHEHLAPRLFLFAWTVSQWIVLIGAGSNKIISIPLANLSVAMFFFTNIYFGVDANEFSEEERTRLYGITLRMVVTASNFIIMYKIPTAFSYAVSMYVPYSTHFSGVEFILNSILVVSWLIFVFLDKYEVFARFPKTEFKEQLYGMMPLTSEKICIIGFLYILIDFTLLRVR